MSTTPKRIDTSHSTMNRRQRFTQMGQTGTRRSSASPIRPLQDRIGLWGDVEPARPRFTPPPAARTFVLTEVAARLRDRRPNKPHD
ncbi:MAG: hypothetical protein QM803_10390 [Rhodocyclaceae bacterium]